MDMIEHSRSTIGIREEKAALRVIRSNFLAEGEEVRKFEHELSDYIGAKGGVAVSTGTLALHLALLALRVGAGDEVIIPSYSCRSLLNSVIYCGAIPKLCDVSREDYNISFNDAKVKISRRTKAIIVPHMFGYPAQIDRFKELGVNVIEDCAHSIGADYKGRKLGRWGDLSIFSFEGTKYIVTGEGGMVLANSRPLLDRLKKLKEPNSLDFKAKYTYRMTNLQAAIGREQLSRLPFFIKKRREIAKRYTRVFSKLDIAVPQELIHNTHIYHRYMIQIKSDIDAFMQRCYRKGVKVKQPVKPYPLHRYLGLSAKRFSNTEYIMRSAVSIPIYPSLEDKQIRHIIKIVREVSFGG